MEAAVLLCSICKAPAKPCALPLCVTCGKSYDRWNKSPKDDGTMAALIKWTADRCHQAMRKKKP